MPSVTSISQLHCAGRAESRARALVAGHIGQAWLCTAGVVPAFLCCSWALGCRNQGYFMHDRPFPLWDQTVSTDFRANVLFSGSSCLPSSVVLGYHRSCWKQLLHSRGWFKYSLTFVRVCSSWKRAVIQSLLALRQWREQGVGRRARLWKRQVALKWCRWDLKESEVGIRKIVRRHCKVGKQWFRWAFRCLY